MNIQSVKKIAAAVNSVILLLVFGLMAFFVVIDVGFLVYFSIPTALVYIVGFVLIKKEMLEVTNEDNKSGTLADALVGADIFIGVSAPGIVTEEMVRSMNKDAVIFAMANPVPEIMPDLAKKAGARVIGTGRSDFPNQVNNVLVFPGIFKGALEGKARQITEDMKLTAARALASLVSDEELSEDFILPEAFDPRVADVVSEAVRENIQPDNKLF